MPFPKTSSRRNDFILRAEVLETDRWMQQVLHCSRFSWRWGHHLLAGRDSFLRVNIFVEDLQMSFLQFLIACLCCFDLSSLITLRLISMILRLQLKQGDLLWTSCSWRATPATTFCSSWNHEVISSGQKLIIWVVFVCVCCHHRRRGGWNRKVVV